MARVRPEMILGRLEEQGACTYDELAKLLGVSTMTIRRDVDQLAERGAVIKILGGVQRANAPAALYESEIQLRLRTRLAEKAAIARRALQLISPDQTLFLDGSSTCIELAKLIAEECRGLTVVTNSALVSIELGRAPAGQIMIVCIGGQYDAASGSFVGPSSEEAAQRFFVDLAFFSTKGLVPAQGCFESSVATFRIKQIIASQCSRLVMLVDHSKFGQRALCRVFNMSQLHTVITDEKAPRAAVSALKKHGCEVLIAPLSRTRQLQS